MTTIAYRDGVLAADSASCAGGTWSGSTRKIGRAPDGSIAALSGTVVDCHAVLRWVEHGMDERKRPVEQDVAGLLITADGTVYLVEGNAPPAPITAPFYAAGSGRQIALGAMAAGASAQRAVEIACEWDTGSRGPVVVERL